MNPESLGAILRMERFKRNLTQQEVCEAIQMKLSTLSKIENNKIVRGSTVKRLMDFYDLKEATSPSFFNDNRKTNIEKVRL
jgi:transcriptional regulator with XRE-family HTH domain